MFETVAFRCVVWAYDFLSFQCTVHLFSSWGLYANETFPICIIFFFKLILIHWSICMTKHAQIRYFCLFVIPLNSSEQHRKLEIIFICASYHHIRNEVVSDWYGNIITAQSTAFGIELLDAPFLQCAKQWNIQFLYGVEVRRNNEYIFRFVWWRTQLCITYITFEIPLDLVSALDDILFNGLSFCAHLSTPVDRLYSLCILPWVHPCSFH